MGLAKPYFDRRQFDDWTRDQLVDALIEAKISAFELNRKMQVTGPSSAGHRDPSWYCTGQPHPYTPADGQW